MRSGAFRVLAVAFLTAVTSCSEEGDQSQTTPEWLACSSSVVVGTLLDVRQQSPDDTTAVSVPPFDAREERPRILVTVDVAEWIKPSSGPDRAEFDIIDPEPVSGEPLQTGGRILVVVPIDRTEEAAIFEGRWIRSELARLRKALPKSETLACPGA